ncbi:hypothetical protein RYX36_014210 [Vicia faba]
MNPPNLPTGKPYSFLMNKERPFSRQNPLKVNKESRKITKNPPLPKPQKMIKQIEEPRIIYTVPQRVIHASPQDFKDIVQRLTGIEQPTGDSKVSPAATLASSERTSPERKERPFWSNGDDDMMRMLDSGVPMSQFPGIVLPEPAVLPPLPYENFLPPQMPQMQYNNFLPPQMPQMQYNNFLPPEMPQMQYNNFLPPVLPQMQYNNFLPPRLPQQQYNNSLPVLLPPVTSESLMQLTTSEIFPPVNNVPIPPDSFLPNTWQEKPSNIFSSDTALPLEFFPPERLPSTQSDNLLPDNWHPSDTFSPVTLPSAESGNFSPDNWSPSDIFSADTCEPSDILSPVLPSTQSDPWQPIPLDNFSRAPLPPTPSDNWLPSDTFSPETSQPKPYEVFSPVLGQQSQTVLSYDGVWPENRIFAKPPEFIPADVVPPHTRWS